MTEEKRYYRADAEDLVAEGRGDVLVYYPPELEEYGPPVPAREAARETWEARERAARLLGG